MLQKERHARNAIKHTQVSKDQSESRLLSMTSLKKKKSLFLWIIASEVFSPLDTTTEREKKKTDSLFFSFLKSFQQAKRI